MQLLLAYESVYPLSFIGEFPRSGSSSQLMFFLALFQLPSVDIMYYCYIEPILIYVYPYSEIKFFFFFNECFFGVLNLHSEIIFFLPGMGLSEFS